MGEREKEEGEKGTGMGERTGNGKREELGAGL